MCVMLCHGLASITISESPIQLKLSQQDSDADSANVVHYYVIRVFICFFFLFHENPVHI